MDALVFTELGKVFASVLTGNFVLLGVAAATSGIDLSAPITVLTGYLVGVVAAGRWCRGEQMRRVHQCLGAEAVLVGALAILIGVAHDHAGLLLPLVLASLAMGIQSAAVMAADSSSPTTYLTSTFTRFFSDVAADGTVDPWAVARIAALVIGAGSGVALNHSATNWGFALPAVLIVLAAYLVLRGSRSHEAV